MSDIDRARAWREEMRAVHRRLREAIDLARTSLEDGRHSDIGHELLLYCWGFCAALSGHHRREDGMLFPLLIAQHPEIEPIIHQLRQDHSMIEHLLGGLRGAMEANETAEEKSRHLDGIEAVMLTHFRYEERTLLGLLDELDLTDLTPSSAFGAIA